MGKDGATRLSGFALVCAGKAETEVGNSLSLVSDSDDGP